MLVAAILIESSCQRQKFGLESAELATWVHAAPSVACFIKKKWGVPILYFTDDRLQE